MRRLPSPQRVVSFKYLQPVLSTAFEFVTLLSEWKDSKYKTKCVIPAKRYGIQPQHNGTDCHSTNVPSSPAEKKA